ncbi:MAG TPA: UvrD-helicase domain-containing protein [Candidatus Paceibacterota bacterium]|nr:UvrD-helicase domain-containing protein [Candidatus Paceibacterota bacterium]
MEYLSDLNDRQREAVEHAGGPLLILAGAGAGKTKTLTYRILHLIRKGIDPRSILAITFTNKAAQEMRERITALLEKDRALNMPISFMEKPFVSTFHVFGATLLRENAEKAGTSKNFTIFDRSDSKNAVKQAMELVNINPKEFEPSKVLSMISREKGNGVTVRYFLDSRPREFISSIVGKVWEAYEGILAKEKSLDFDDLLLKASKLLEDEEIRAKYQEKYKYIHIDEYQDTNRVQYKIGRLLSEKSRNICVVGDADQTIYTWRGADISNILNFERDYPEARVVLLEQNYRSTGNILKAANAVIDKNKKRRKKVLFTENAPGDLLSLYGAYDEADEANFIALKAKELITSGVQESEIAVLYRANFQSRILEEAFLAHSVPHFVLGTRFYDRKEVKDILAYIRAALNPDCISDIKRVINSPARGIGKVTMLKILSTPRESLDPATFKKAEPFFQILTDIQEKSITMLPGELVGYTLTRSGILGEYQAEKTDENEEKIQNLKELVSLGARYDEHGPEGIIKFLEDTSLLSDQDALQEKKEGVRLMTVHASKGLEFQFVFVTGLEDGLFPQVKKSEEGSVQEDRAEEERRLFYVALTRARIKLYLSYTSVRTIFGKTEVNVPSTFLADIHDSLITYEERKNPGGKRERVIYFD